MSTIPEKITLLYIEDDNSIADITLEYLKAFKHTEFIIVYKRTLKEGLEYLNAECSIEEECKVDAILLDLVLPNSSGVSTFKKVQDKCDFLPIVIMSGHEEMACECVKLGAQDYLLKAEITPGILIRALKYSIERVSLEKKREHSEEKFRNLVEVTGAGIYEIDFVSGKFVYVNSVMCKQTGWSKKELLNMGPSDILTRHSYIEWIRRWESLNKGKYIEEAFEYEARKKDGSTIWGLITAKFIEDKNENIVGANVVAIDITNQKQAEEKLRRKEADVYTMLESKIHEWKEEIGTRDIENKEQLKIINGEILSMCNNSVEVL